MCCLSIGDMETSDSGDGQGTSRSKVSVEGRVRMMMACDADAPPGAKPGRIATCRHLLALHDAASSCPVTRPSTVQSTMAVGGEGGAMEGTRPGGSAATAAGPRHCPRARLLVDYQPLTFWLEGCLPPPVQRLSPACSAPVSLMKHFGPFSERRHGPRIHVSYGPWGLDWLLPCPSNVAWAATPAPVQGRPLLRMLSIPLTTHPSLCNTHRVVSGGPVPP